jgi:hypothetical protein
MTAFDIQKIQNILEEKFCYLDFKWETTSLDTMRKKLSDFGLILRGGTEERLGVKTYEDLDEIFDLLSN